MDTIALPTGTWDLAPSTTVQLTIKKLKFITVEATVSLRSGSVTIAEDGSVAAVSARLVADSFDSGNEKRDTHVRGADFLETDTHPEITFTSTSVESAASGHRVDGTITIKGQSHSLTLLVGDLQVDDDTASFTATSQIDRVAVGIDKMPAFVISRMIELRIDARCDRVS